MKNWRLQSNWRDLGWILEAGFAIASPGDFKAVKAVAENVKNATVASLAKSIGKGY